MMKMAFFDSRRECPQTPPSRSQSPHHPKNSGLLSPQAQYLTFHRDGWEHPLKSKPSTTMELS